MNWPGARRGGSGSRDLHAWRTKHFCATYTDETFAVSNTGTCEGKTHCTRCGCGGSCPVTSMTLGGK